MLFYTHKWRPDFYRSSPMCAIVSNNFDNISVQRSISKWSVDFWSKLREIWAIACWLMPTSHLQKVSEKFRLKVNGIDDFSARFSGKFPGSRKRLKRQSCFSWWNVPNESSCSIFLQSHVLVPVRFRFSCPFCDGWNWFVQMVNAIPGRNLLVLNFA